MNTFKDAAQVKVSLKMQLSNYAWFKSILVRQENSGYCVVVSTHKIDNFVRKVIPQVINGVSIKVETDN